MGFLCCHTSLFPQTSPRMGRLIIDYKWKESDFWSVCGGKQPMSVTSTQSAQKHRPSLKSLVSSVIPFNFFRKLGAQSPEFCLICRRSQSWKGCQEVNVPPLITETLYPGPHLLCTFSELGNSPVMVRRTSHISGLLG